MIAGVRQLRSSASYPSFFVALDVHTLTLTDIINNHWLMSITSSITHMSFNNLATPHDGKGVALRLASWPLYYIFVAPTIAPLSQLRHFYAEVCYLQRFPRTFIFVLSNKFFPYYITAFQSLLVNNPFNKSWWLIRRPTFKLFPKIF